MKVLLNFLTEVFRQLCSLKLAVIIILSLAAGLAAGTVIESVYDTPTSQYWVYQAFWFRGLLFMLGLNIFCVALSRYPWKLHHIPFLLAHLGILILLAGSFVTERWGIDGNLRIPEGETASLVELDHAALYLSEDSKLHRIPIPWIPPHVSFKSIRGSAWKVPYDVVVDQYISHADPEFSFEADSKALDRNSAAVQIHLSGGPMQMSEDIWLWEGRPEWQVVKAGPAQFSIQRNVGDTLKDAHGAALVVVPSETALSFWARSGSGSIKKGSISLKQIEGKVFEPGWKGGVKVTVKKWLPSANLVTHYKPSRIQYGQRVSPPAIHLSAVGGATGVWLGLGDRAVLHVDQHDIQIGFFPGRVSLPFTVRLDRFTVDHDQGTMTPAAYSSRVTMTDLNSGQKDILISMNEPLEHKGFTLYQASYEDGDPRPTVTILSVNRDPGRFWKYLGSALIVLGSILLFAAKYKKARRQKRAAHKSALGQRLPEFEGAPL